MINVSNDLVMGVFEGKDAPEARGYPLVGVLPRICRCSSVSVIR